MGFENFRKPPYQTVQKKRESKISSDFTDDINRREFLKEALVKAAKIFGAAALYTLYDTPLNFNEDSNLSKDTISEPLKKQQAIKENNSTVKSIEKNRKIETPKDIIEEILRTYGTEAITKRMDRSVLTEDFFMALQFQESRYNPKAESNQGAKGVFQDLPKATQNVVTYLSFLRRKGKSTKTGVACDYRGPDSITLKQAEEIGDLLKEKSNYGRSLGKLYCLCLHDSESAYNTSPNPDVFRRIKYDQSTKKWRHLSVEEQQDLIALAYHSGPVLRLNPEKAGKNGKFYLALVHQHLKIIKEIRDKLISAGMSGRNNYAIITIMQELDRGENRNQQSGVINNCLKILQNDQLANGMIGTGKVIPDKDIDRLLKKA